MALMPVETKMTGRQLAGAVVMGMHFPPVRALAQPYVGVTYLRKPINNTATQRAAQAITPFKPTNTLK